MLSIGLMSGTSMDGIDAALLETDGSPSLIRPIGHISFPYDPSLKLLFKATEFAFRKFGGDQANTSAYYLQAVQEYCREELNLTEQDFQQIQAQWADAINEEALEQRPLSLQTVIQHSTSLHAKAVNALLNHLDYLPRQIDVVGYHGQCMFHRPAQKISIIVGDGQGLAEQLGITVVNDFRRCDIEAGGQGAPFAPLYHQALAVNGNRKALAVVNCGGIANITLINGPLETEVQAFDTGPGNGLVDRLVRQRTQGRENMDLNGAYGLRGAIHEPVLDALFELSVWKEGQNYFKVKPPKALDIGDLQLIPALDALSLEDACATLEIFTARSIVRSLDFVKTPLPQQWVLAGGGWHNPVIYRELVTALREKLGAELSIQTADEAGWNSQAMEAQIFAYLAVRSLQNKPLSVFGTTGVPKPLSGGYASIPSVGPSSAVKALLSHNPAVLAGYRVI